MQRLATNIMPAKCSLQRTQIEAAQISDIKLSADILQGDLLALALYFTSHVPGPLHL